jgi:hypothetical protein
MIATYRRAVEKDFDRSLWYGRVAGVDDGVWRLVVGMNLAEFVWGLGKRLVNEALKA